MQKVFPRKQLYSCIGFILFFAISLYSKGQTFEARYKIFQQIYNTAENGIEKNVATLDFDGFLFQRKGRFIYYKKPLYLGMYPDGYIHVANSNNEILIGVVMDTIQGLRYLNFDSLITRSRFDISGINGGGLNVKRSLKKGIITWKYTGDTKEIHGLKCQKAEFINANGKLQWVVWFCPDINVLAGPAGIRDLPGLVVEGENVITNEKYVLISYKGNVSLVDEIFWPNEFNQPFH
jgi:GLPGLI family protein